MINKRSTVSCLLFPRKRESRKDGISDKTTGLDSCLRGNDYNFTVFNSSEEGFTLVELLITMVIFVLTIAAASSIFVPLLTQFKQQSKLAETQIESIVGLDTLRRDLEQAGFGLPWVIPTGVSYQEGSSSTTAPIPAPNNTSINDAITNPPRAIASINNVAGLGGSDYLVIKATSVATNDAAMKWTYVVGAAGGGSGTVKEWASPPSPTEDLINGDNVIALIPTRGKNNQRILVNDGANFSITFAQPLFPSAFSPTTEGDVYLVYGVDPDTILRMPFNRADYYIRSVSGTTIPPRCAAGTGILMKSVINQADGNRGAGMPLLDCVADMQVIYRRDTDNNGDVDNETDDISLLTAQEIREQVKDVRVYILAHEGQRDVNYTYPSSTITVGEFALGRTFDFTASGITNWQNYRWKIYTIVVKPNNLRS